MGRHPLGYDTPKRVRIAQKVGSEHHSVILTTTALIAKGNTLPPYNKKSVTWKPTSYA